MGGAVKNEIMQNKELAEELQKAVIIKFEKRKVQSSFIDNIWGADLPDKFNKGIFFYCVLLSYLKVICVISLKDKKRYYSY